MIIITGYGVHDATEVQEFQQLDLEVLAPGGNGTAQFDLYKNARARGVLAQDDFNTASMASCKKVKCLYCPCAMVIRQRPLP